MQLPGPFRAAVGLAANAADEVKRLPDRAIELPMLAVSTVLQMSLRAQQRYARLTARGDEVIGGRPSEEPPAWATFDDPLPAGELDPLADDRFGERADAARLLDELFGRETDDAAPGPGTDDELVPPTPIRASRKAAARGSAAKAAASAAGPAAAAKAAKAAKKAARTGKEIAESSERAGRKDGPKAAGGKKVSKPRHTAPSKFDDADPDA